MKEIKFRAWDKVDKGMYYDLQSICLKAREVIFYTDKDDNDYWRTFKDCILMQFTGLKDKNGKEIYEGDIVKMDSWEKRKKYKDAKRKNCKGVFTVELTVSSFGLEFDFVNISGYPCPTHLFMSNKNSFEVIGNIYENPDLKKKDL